MLRELKKRRNLLEAHFGFHLYENGKINKDRLKMSVEEFGTVTI